MENKDHIGNLFKEKIQNKATPVSDQEWIKLNKKLKWKRFFKFSFSRFNFYSLTSSLILFSLLAYYLTPYKASLNKTKKSVDKKIQVERKVKTEGTKVIERDTVRITDISNTLSPKAGEKQKKVLHQANSPGHSIAPKTEIVKPAPEKKTFEANLTKSVEKNNTSQLGSLDLSTNKESPDSSGLMLTETPVRSKDSSNNTLSTSLKPDTLEQKTEKQKNVIYITVQDTIVIVDTVKTKRKRLKRSK